MGWRHDGSQCPNAKSQRVQTATCRIRNFTWALSVDLACLAKSGIPLLRIEIRIEFLLAKSLNAPRGVCAKPEPGSSA
jgi:hypothetical protein